MSRLRLLLCAAVLLSACDSAIELDRPLRYPCSLDAGSEAASCPTGYRCGLEGSCHPVGEPAPWQCQVDADCEADWRCGPEGRCVDVASEALRPTAPAQPPRAEELLPSFMTASPRLLAVTSYTGSAPCTPNVEAEVLAWVQEGGSLGIHQRFRSEVWDVPPDTPEDACADLVADGGTTRTLTERTVLLPMDAVALKELAAAGNRVVGLGQAGQLCEVVLTPLGSPALTCEGTVQPADATTLRTPVLASYLAPDHAVAALGEHAFGVQLSPEGPFHGPFAVPATDGGVRRLNDLLLFEEPDEGLVQIFLATDEGLVTTFVRPDGSLSRPRQDMSYSLTDGGWAEETPWDAGAEAGPWLEVAFSSWECLPETVEKPQSRIPLHRLAWAGRIDYAESAVELLVQPASDGPYGNSLLRLKAERQPMQVDSVPVQTCEPVPLAAGRGWGTWRVQPQTEYGAYVCLGDISTLVTNTLPEGGMALEASCEAEDGGTYLARGTWWPSNQGELVQNDSLVRLDRPRSPLLERPLVWARTSPSRTAMANALGQAWMLAQVDRYEQVPVALTPAMASPLVSGDEDTFLINATPTSWRGLAIDTGQQLLGSPEGGVVMGRSNFGDLAPLTAATGLPGAFLYEVQDEGSDKFHAWLQYPTGDDDDIRALAVFSRLTRLAPPFLGTLAPAAGGRHLLLTASQDALYAVDLTEEVNDPTLGRSGDITSFDDLKRPEVALVPVPRADISSLAPLPPAAGDYTRGYLVAGRRVFGYRATNPLVWRAQEVEFPTGVPLEVWADGARGRVGFRDGSVASLPGRVTVAAALPQGAGEAVDFAAVCGNVFVLSRAGLFRLVGPAAGEALAVWQPVPLPESFRAAASPQDGFARARLFEGREGLLLVDPAGRPFRLTQLECLP